MTANIDELINAIENEADGEYTACIKGRKVVFAVNAPSHLEFLNKTKENQNFLVKFQAGSEGDIYEEKDVKPVRAYVDAHIHSINGTAWADVPQEKRVQLIASLGSADFFGLLNTIEAGSSLEADEKNG